MSQELPLISTPDAISRIKRLIQSKQGDPGRLQYISEKLQKGRKLFHSDEIYLTHKISAKVIPVQIKEPTETDRKIKIVKSLLALNLGDAGRLRHILKTLEKGKELFHSDEYYLEEKTKQLREYTEQKRLKQRVRTRPKPEVIEPEISQPIPEEPSFEEHVPEELPQEVTEPKISQERIEPQEEYIQPRTPERKPSADLFDLIADSEKTEMEIRKERHKIRKLELEKDQLRIQREELAKLIAYRQEYELRINKEKENLQKEIQIEQEKVKEKDLLVEELIKNQAKLIQAKSEREVLLEQIKVDKEKSEEELKEAQEELTSLKKQYEEFQEKIDLKKKELDDQIKEQKEKLDSLKKNSEDKE